MDFKLIYRLCVICTIFFSVNLAESNVLQDHDIEPNSIADSEKNGSNWVIVERTNRENKPFEVKNDTEDHVQRNCTEQTINDFPQDLFTRQQRQQGAILFHVFLAFYCFLITAFICNDYLLPAMDCICSDLRITPNVAGATFLAVATCFPEFFINVVGTFLTESDLGVGTVLGGTVFNTFAVPAFGGLVAVKGIQLEVWPLTRDVVICMICMGTLGAIMWDDTISWYESTILAVLFVAYFTFLFLGKSIFIYAKKTTCSKTGAKLSGEKGTKDNSKNDVMAAGIYRSFHSELMMTSVKPMNGEITSTKDPESQEQDDPDGLFSWPSDSITARTWFIFVWPLRFVLFSTIPDCRYKNLRNWYPVTFVMCIVWIAIISYLVSWMVTVVGDTVGINDSIIGITILAAGGNLPEAISTVILAKQGQGDMAISNSLGANSLNVLLCLTFPWLTKTLMSDNNVKIVSGALTYSVLSVLACLIGLYTVIALNKFRLDKKIGAVCLLLYVTFLTFDILLESNVFFFVNWPMCED